jgi:hypothetical protein
MACKTRIVAVVQNVIDVVYLVKLRLIRDFRLKEMPANLNLNLMDPNSGLDSIRPASRRLRGVVFPQRTLISWILGAVRF